MLTSTLEIDLINNISRKFCRSPYQQNKIHESDAEILQIPGGTSSITITTDSISEEISTHLYSDPYLIGWMIVMVNFSDIAAVGAEPLGIVISEILPENLSDEYIESIQSGISDAAAVCGSFILGGDTNAGERLVLTGTAIGKSINNKYLKRSGCSKGEILFASGKAGKGNAYAIMKLLSGKSAQFKYLPAARLSEASIIRNYASCCIDSSDGFLSSLDQLMRLNNCGFNLVNPETIIDEDALCIAKIHNIPAWLLLAGQHGEFELIFSIPQKVENKFLKAAAGANLFPVKLGVATENAEILMNVYDKIRTIDTKKLRDLPFLTKGDIKKYLDELLKYDQELRL